MPECSPEEYARSITNRSSITCLGKEDSIGITLTAEAGLVSLLAILYVVAIIAHNVRKRNSGLRIFHRSMDILMASLLLADALQAIGMVLSLKWVQDGKVEIGSFCNAQGIIKIFGATGVALSTLAIAVYTFLGIWVMANISMRFTYGLVLVIWSFIGLLVGLAMKENRNKEFSFMGPTPYWCWVNKHDVGIDWKMAVEYLWMWLTLALSLLIYIPLFLWMRGNLIIGSERARVAERAERADAKVAWWRFSFDFSTNFNPEIRANRNKAMVMLAYPVVYCLCILPLSAVRWKSFVQTHSIVSPGATFFVVAIFGLSGFFNVVLLLKTRPSAPLFGQMMLLKPVLDDSEEGVDMGGLPPEVPGH